MFNWQLRMIRCLAVVGAVLLLAIVGVAAKQFVMPKPNDAKSYLAHDEHPEEKVTVAIDSYDGAEKSAIFALKYAQAGFLPLFVVITNDGDSPIALTSMEAKLVTADRSKISPARPNDMFRRFAKPNSAATTSRPWPTKKVKGGLNQQEQDEIENAQFAARAVEPHSTQAGFLFFDVEGISDPLVGAQFFLTGVRDAKGSEVMYFEVSTNKPVNASPQSQ